MVARKGRELEKRAHPPTLFCARKMVRINLGAAWKGKSEAARPAGSEWRSGEGL